MTYKVPFVNYGSQFEKLKYEVIPKIVDVIEKGNFVLRENVEEFESKLAKFVGTKYAVAVNSCTDALFLSLKALGIKEGDEVITVSHTFVATIQVIAQVGATPILVDINKDYLMDVDCLEKSITIRTKAIIPVHLSGDMCDMEKIMEIADKYGLVVVEDAAQALGASIGGKKAGAWGKTGCFSFYPAKILGAYGDSGAITTDDKELADKLRLIRDHYNIGKIELETLVEFGYNSRMDGIQGAVLSVKIDHLQEYLDSRQEIASIYDKGLSGLPLILPRRREGRVYQDYVVRSDKAKEIRDFLYEQGIDTYRAGLFGVGPNHFYKSLGLNFSLPITESVVSEVFRLPCNPEITAEQANYVVNKIQEYYEKNTL